MFKHLLVISLLLIGASAQNNYPVVLVHGFLGWGRDELLGTIKYWGGIQGDLQQYFVNQGLNVVTVAMGPVSSNWDRACELYAQIMGGTVDYGLVHSQKFQHARFGRTYPGLVSGWGPNLKVHLVAHSQGGQDARLVTWLLNNGDPAEQAGTPAGSLSPLFQGGNNWIASVTTVNSPHDGTTLASGVGFFGNAVKTIVGYIAGLDGVVVDNLVYDFKLDQFGLQRQAGETFSAYEQRVLNSSIFLPGQKDTALWSLQPEGANELNGYVKAVPNVFYSTWNADATYTGIFNGDAYPDATQLFILWPFSTFMGQFTRPAGNGLIGIDSTWFHSDGVVNSRSGKGPTLNTTDKIVPLNGGNTLSAGVFNYVQLLDQWDHVSLIGFGLHNIYPLYTQIINVAHGLPPQASAFQVSTINFALQTNFSNVMNATNALNCSVGIQTYYSICNGNAISNNANNLSLTPTQCSELASQLKIACNVTVVVPVSNLQGAGASLNVFLALILFLVYITKEVSTS